MNKKVLLLAKKIVSAKISLLMFRMLILGVENREERKQSNNDN